MTEQTILEIETVTTDIVVAVTNNPGIVLLDEEKYNVWYEKLKAKAPTVTDMTVRKNRESLRSFAAEVRSEKAAIDKARLRMTKEWRDMVTQANAVGKTIESQLEELATESRKPLTEWENAENTRLSECRFAISEMKIAAQVSIHDSAADVRQRGMDVWNTVLDSDEFGDMLEEAQAAKDAAINALKVALARLTQEEADKAELERLRAENEARIERERAEEEAMAAKTLAEEEARKADERRLADEKAEAERLARVEQEAADRAKREAEAAAQAERERVQREHEAALAAERDRAKAAEQAAQAERDRAAAEQAKREADERAARELADQAAADQAKRERNRAHRAQLMGEAKIAIMAAGSIEESAAVLIVKAIVDGRIPHVSMEF